MDRIAKWLEEDRAQLFELAASALGISTAIIEKDFWVCWVLDYLFRDSQWQDKLIFKGGTSLSKAYGAIQRFSEDVDLVIDWTQLGYTEEEAFRDRTNKKQDLFCREVSDRTVDFLRDTFVPVLTQELSDRLGVAIKTSQDEQIVAIEYPRSFSIEYVRPVIALEIGPKALHEPNEMVDIRPYAAERFPDQFEKPNTTVRTVSSERTFWEKATILHQEAHREAGKKLPLRYSRHYYDLYQLSKMEMKTKAIGNIGLLSDVAKFKTKFFRCGWARYELAKPGTLRLTPPEHNIKALRNDYASMQSMLFGVVPTFDEILVQLDLLETEINEQSL